MTISASKRRRVYERDGYRCVWCLRGVYVGRVAKNRELTTRVATLDHVIPRARGGDDLCTNLVTACVRCNDDRGKLDIVAFAKLVVGGDERGVPAVIARIRTAISTPLPK